MLLATQPDGVGKLAEIGGFEDRQPPGSGGPDDWERRSVRKFVALIVVSYLVPAAMIFSSSWSFDPVTAVAVLNINEPRAVETVRTAADSLDALRSAIADSLPVMDVKGLAALNEDLKRLSGQWGTAAQAADDLAKAVAAKTGVRPATLAAFYHLKAATLLQLCLAAAIIVWASIYLLSEKKATLRAKRKVGFGFAVAALGAAINLLFVYRLRLVDGLSNEILAPILAKNLPDPAFGVSAVLVGLSALAFATGLTIVIAAFVATEFRPPSPDGALTKAISSAEDAVPVAARLKTLKQVLILNAVLFLATLLMLEMLAAFVTSTLPAEIGGESNPAATQLRALLSAMNLSWALGFTVALAFIYIPAAAFLLPHAEEDPKEKENGPTSWTGEVHFRFSGPGDGTATVTAAPVPKPAEPPKPTRRKPPDWSDGLLFIADDKIFGRVAQLATILSPALFKGFLDLISAAN